MVVLDRHNFLRIDRIELRLVRLPLVRTFRTSSSTKDHIDHILVHVVDPDGAEGWGECASPADPYYCPETTGTCWHLLHDFLGPSVLGKDWATIDDLVGFYRLVKGNNFAKSGVGFSYAIASGSYTARRRASSGCSACAAPTTARWCTRRKS